MIAFFIGGFMKSFLEMKVADLNGVINLDENIISHKKLLEILDYNPETGIFTWKITRGWRAQKGTTAGSINEKGYIVIFTECRIYKAHRLAWFYMTGEWPTETDHINRIKTDNRFCNLRNSTRTENARNSGISKSNKSGFKGVSWNKQNKKWQAKAKVNGKRVYLGFFSDKEDAALAYKQFAEKIHGEFFVGADALRNT